MKYTSNYPSYYLWLSKYCKPVVIYFSLNSMEVNITRNDENNIRTFQIYITQIIIFQIKTHNIFSTMASI